MFPPDRTTQTALLPGMRPASSAATPAAPRLRRSFARSSRTDRLRDLLVETVTIASSLSVEDRPREGSGLLHRFRPRSSGRGPCSRQAARSAQRGRPEPQVGPCSAERERDPEQETAPPPVRQHARPQEADRRARARACPGRPRRTVVERMDDRRALFLGSGPRRDQRLIEQLSSNDLCSVAASRSSFASAGFSGMNTVAPIPASRAAQATACP